MALILVPVDCSEFSLLAIRHLIGRARGGEPLRLHLLNVQPRFSFLVARFLCHGEIARFRRERAAEALDRAEQPLKEAGIACTTEVRFGDAAREIVRCARAGGFDAIVMGSWGIASLAEVLCGSITARVLRSSPVPVEVIPAPDHRGARAYADGAGLAAAILVLAYLAFE